MTSSSGDAAWVDHKLAARRAESRRVVDEVRAAALAHFARLEQVKATPQTPGSPTPGFVSDWPAGHYSGDAAGRPDRPEGVKATQPQSAKELFDQVTAAPGVLKISAETLLPIQAAHEPYLLEVEGRLVANAAQEVHKKGQRFDGWPRVTRTYLRYAGPTEVTPTYFRGFVITDRASAEHVQLRLDGWTAPR